MKGDKSYSMEDFAAVIVEMVLKEKELERKILISKVGSLLHTIAELKNIPKGYNVLEHKLKRAKMLRELKRNDNEIKFWKNIVRASDPENIQSHYDRLDREEFEKGFRSAPKDGSQITCYYCERVMDAAMFGGTNGIHSTTDHVIPRSKNGNDSMSNKVNSCNECNCLKADLRLPNFIFMLMGRINTGKKFMGIPVELYPVIIKNAKKLLEEQTQNTQ